MTTDTHSNASIVPFTQVDYQAADDFLKTFLRAAKDGLHSKSSQKLHQLRARGQELLDRLNNATAGTQISLDWVAITIKKLRHRAKDVLNLRDKPQTA